MVQHGPNGAPRGVGTRLTELKKAFVLTWLHFESCKYEPFVDN